MMSWFPYGEYRWIIGLRYYIASSLSNASEVIALRDELKAEGHIQTYDWCLHGAVFKDGATRGENVAVMQETALKEAAGVETADAVIVMLPGGKGTHVELGMALALKKPVIMVSDVHPYYAGQEHNDKRNFPCAFWFHPLVRHVERGEAVKAVRELTVELRAKTRVKHDAMTQQLASIDLATTLGLAAFSKYERADADYSPYDDASHF